MSSRTPSTRKPCTPSDRVPCTSYAAGHNVHFIHAKHVGRTPWGWRDGVVTAHGGDTLAVRYVETDHEVRVWHHRALPALELGSPVRVHEEYYVVGGPFGWLSVVLTGGLGAVPEPADPEEWAPQMVRAVVNLATGVGIPMDHTRSPGWNQL